MLSSIINKIHEWNICKLCGICDEQFRIVARTLRHRDGHLRENCLWLSRSKFRKYAYGITPLSFERHLSEHQINVFLHYEDEEPNC
ncbi:hypothetical protein KP509_08G004100 [Ceratopteris richardii]|uniref:C2H2-type domain-containing protein n=1 Tax=Ceratopteris richardii TaxID=49495 RepID=A0A8T2UB89_CERRI|nr:hypothetical protein KP509_08G004100 [Ceratopteris richardii]